MSRPNSPDLEAMRAAVRAFLEAAGLAVDGTELEHTPARVTEAWTSSFLDGYDKDPKQLLADPYPQAADANGTALVLLRDIAFQGMCPHHLLPFHGKAHVAYLPAGELASLSSVVRLVDCFAHRLEIQETVTRQIAEALVQHLGARGAAVAIETDQTCMTTRGVSRHEARTVTRHFSGAFVDEPDLRNEFLAGIG